MFSPKLGRFVSISSKLEMEQVLLLEFDLTVVKYCEQPATAEAVIGGRLLRSRFDFWVLDVNGRSQFIEVKYASELRDPLSRAHRQIAIQKQWCSEQGYNHLVVTDEQIWANPIRINSLRTLLHEYTGRFPRLVVAASQAMPAVEQIIQRTPCISISRVLESRPRALGVEVWRLAIMELIRGGLVDAALERIALSPTSPLRIVEGGAR
ncbi:MAG TPA: TnsA endonuclease N-terminal domain-containing protein [Rariglobus sp.]|nr:TnsA endonuclease N-terminal domain-containing protein [Rariglobus sp.]